MFIVCSVVFSGGMGFLEADVGCVLSVLFGRFTSGNFSIVVHVLF